MKYESINLAKLRVAKFNSQKMACTVDLTITNLVILGVILFVVKWVWKLLRKWKVDKMLEQWDNCPVRDKVILHSFSRCKDLPSISPFGLKLETFLRMTKIPYELDSKNPYGPKGKIPWMTYNGTHVTDSHLCIEFLKKKFSLNMNKSATAENLAAARVCRIMLEDHFFFGVAQFRVLETGFFGIAKLPSGFKYALPFITRRVRNKLEQNGIGKHSLTEIQQIMADDLRTVAGVLGDKKFMGGDLPCEEDCAVFGMVAQAVWGMPGSLYERLVNGELIILKSYCERMKELYWPDWNECLDN